MSIMSEMYAMDDLSGNSLDLSMDSFLTGFSWNTLSDLQTASPTNAITPIEQSSPASTPTEQHSPTSSAPGRRCRRDESKTPAPIKFQVCGNCRRKKRKCSLERPACSLCLENGWTCEYRCIKRKPGPAKGSVGLRAPVVEERSKTSIAIVINESAKRELIDLYFAHVQPTYPMFCKQSFEQDLAEKKIPDALFNAMLALASRFIPVTDVPALLGSLYPAPWDDFARLAERQMQDQEDKNTPILLNDIKAFALLTLYEYTKFPGRRAWMMVGNLVRMALSIGLHCLDSGQQSLSLSDFELEEHRFVWWTVWNLDSAINTLTGAPCGIESDNTSTALVSTSVADFTAGKSTQSTQQFLPVDSERIWKSAQQLLNNDTEDGTNMYYLAICHLRHVMAFRRRLYTNPTPQSARHLTVLRNSLSYMRLSLPSWYFEPARQLLLETPDKHRLRLESLLILLISQIHVLEPITNTQLADIMRDDDLGNWVGCISIGEDIAAIFKAWRPGYFTGADPITSTIIWYTTCILTIHTMSNFGQFDEIPDQRLVSALDLLSLALDRFAQHWQISRILADALKSLQGWAWVRLGLSDIVSLLSQLRVPIDPMKQDPGTFNMWQIVEQAASVMAEIDGLSSPRAQRLDTSPAKPGV